MAAEDFVIGIDRLVNQVGHWEPARWAAPGPAGGATRGDLVHALVQRLADLGAAAEGDPLRAVPRPGDLVLADQLRVVADDLVAAAPGADVLQLATEQVSEVRRAL